MFTMAAGVGKDNTGALSPAARFHWRGAGFTLAGMASSPSALRISRRSRSALRSFPKAAGKPRQCFPRVEIRNPRVRTGSSLKRLGSRFRLAMAWFIRYGARCDFRSARPCRALAASVLQWARSVWTSLANPAQHIGAGVHTRVSSSANNMPARAVPPALRVQEHTVGDGFRHAL